MTALSMFYNITSMKFFGRNNLNDFVFGLITIRPKLLSAKDFLAKNILPKNILLRLFINITYLLLETFFTANF